MIADPTNIQGNRKKLVKMNKTELASYKKKSRSTAR